MKNKIMLATLLTMIAIPVYAQGNIVPANEAVPAAVAADPVMEQVAALQTKWSEIKYQMNEKETQLDAIHQLEEQAAALTEAHPDRPEAKIWEGIILSTDAGIVKGISALGKVKKAKNLFEQSLEQDPNAMQGSAYTSLGSLYYQVPGWPVAFGDDKKAEENLKMALQINPEGIDPNYFYGDFLLKNGNKSEAKTYFQKALLAPDRPGRALADQGRRQEIKSALEKTKDNNKGYGYN